MPLVTISASYGAGGGVIAPEVAKRLGVPFLDRAIASEVADRLDMSVAEVLERVDTVGTSHGIGKLLAGLASLGAMVGAASPDPGAEGEEADAESLQREAERAVRELTDTGDGVILGRAAALILADRTGALHVRLDGPPQARAALVARSAGIELDEAERRRRANDDARQAYVRHFYGVDPGDVAHYHLVLDTTALDWDLCTDLITRATRLRAPAREP